VGREAEMWEVDKRWATIRGQGGGDGDGKEEGGRISRGDVLGRMRRGGEGEGAKCVGGKGSVSGEGEPETVFIFPPTAV